MVNFSKCDIAQGFKEEPYRERKGTVVTKNTRTGLIDRLAASVRASYEADRRRNPHCFVGSPDGLGSEFLFVENVARMLGSSVDFVRRIPRSELPAAKIGARVIYRRQDVAAFITSRRDSGRGGKLVPSRMQRLSGKGSKLQLVAPRAGGSFDPVRHVRNLVNEGTNTHDESKAKQ